MKKIVTLMSMTALCLSAPAFANDMDDKDHLEKKVKFCLQKADTNGDGMISRAEHDTVSAQMFTQSDTDNNGSISLDELRVAKKKEKQEMKSFMEKSN